MKKMWMGVFLSEHSVEAMFVWWLFADRKMTVAWATLLSDKVAWLCCISDMGLTYLRIYDESQTATNWHIRTDGQTTNQPTNMVVINWPL